MTERTKEVRLTDKKTRNNRMKDEERRRQMVNKDG